MDCDETQWMQATLSVKDGGLGIRCANTLATSPFFSIWCQITLSSNQFYLHLTVYFHPVTSSAQTRSGFTIEHTCPGTILAEDSSGTFQRAWDAPVVRTVSKVVFTSMESRPWNLRLTEPDSKQPLQRTRGTSCMLRQSI